MHATIDVRFELSIDDDKTLPLATLAEAVTDQNLEAVLLESLVESLDAASVEGALVRNTHMATVTSASTRAGTDTRTAVTTAGEHEFSLHYVEDTAASPDESQLLPARRRRSRLRRAEPLSSAGHRRQKRRSRYLAQLSRRCQSRRQLRLDAVADHHQPPCQEIRPQALKQFLPDCVAGTDADAVIPDGTKCHSSKTTTARPTPSKQRSAKTPPKSHAPCWICRSTLTGTKLPPKLDDIGAVTDDATVVSDADSGIVTAFTDENRDHQLDLVHVGRTLGLHPLGRWRLLLGPSEGDRFGGSTRCSI